MSGLKCEKCGGDEYKVGNLEQEHPGWCAHCYNCNDCCLRLGLCTDEQRNPDACEPCEGRGWLVVALDGDEDRLEIQRCDACDRFQSDAEARTVPAALGAFESARRTRRLQVMKITPSVEELLGAIRQHKRTNGKPTEGDKRLYSYLPEERERAARETQRLMDYRKRKDEAAGPGATPETRPEDEKPLSPSPPKEKPKKIRGITI